MLQLSTQQYLGSRIMRTTAAHGRSKLTTNQRSLSMSFNCLRDHKLKLTGF